MTLESSIEETTDKPAIRIGALIPLSRPGWVEAGQHLLAGLELAIRDINEGGGIVGRPVDLLIRDTAANPKRAVDAVDELAELGVSALAGEYHSFVARSVAARAEALGLSFLCSSAVLDALTDQPANYVARLAPAQSHGWRIYADFLYRAGHRHISIASEASVYWAAGIEILRASLASRGCTVTIFEMSSLSLAMMCDELARSRATAILLLVGFPHPAVPLVTALRNDRRLADVLIGAPAGQPEFVEWTSLLGESGAGIPFLRYLPTALNSLGLKVKSRLQRSLATAPSFVAFEGYDTIIALAELLKLQQLDRDHKGDAWGRVCVHGTRGPIQFSRVPGVSVWQWVGAPVQVVDRDSAQPDRWRVLYSEAEDTA